MPKKTAPLDYEIKLIRKLMKDLIDNPSKRTTYSDRLHLLESVSKASSRLANLMKSSKELDRYNQTDIQTVLNQALDEVLEELRRPSH